MGDEWVVLLEAERGAADGWIGADDTERLQHALEGDGLYAGHLHSANRYALQVPALGAGPIEAVLDVVTRWTNAVRELQLPAWNLVRAEVFTREELEQELERAHREEIDLLGAAPDREPQEHDEIGLELLHRAFSDPLTGLVGGQAFVHRLEAALVAGRGAVAVVSLDLDGFQRLVDLVGEATGDEVIIALARRLSALLRPEDVLARLGSDEYGVLLEETTEEAALAVAQRLLDAVRLPLTFDDHELALSASAGVALGHPGETADDVVANATAARRAARASGGPGLALHDAEVPRAHRAQQGVVTAVLQDRLAHLQLMQRAAVAANEANTLDEAAQVVIRHICAQIGCPAGRLWVPPAASQGPPETPLWHLAAGGSDPALEDAAEAVLGGADVGLAGRVLATGRPAWMTDLPGTGLQAAFAFPVVVGREAVAVMAFFFRTRMEPTDSFLDVVAGIGTQLGRVVERQRAAEALRSSTEELRVSDARLREAQRVARLGSWHFDLRTGANTWSDGLHELYGLDPATPVDLDLALDLLHPEDRARAGAALARLVETGEPTAEEIRIVRSDGEVRWHRSAGSVIRDDDGVVVAIQGMSQDITDRKLAEEAIQAQGRQLSEAQRMAGLGSWELDLSTGRATWSDEMYRLWGWTPGREVGIEELLATVHDEDRPRVADEHDRSRRTGEPASAEFRAWVGGGQLRWFRGGWSGLCDERGSPVKLFGVAQDITDEMQAKEGLRKAEMLYQRIIETTHEGIWTIDTRDVTTFVNPRMALILGYSCDEMLGMGVAEFIDQEDLAALAGQLRRRQTGLSESFETRLRARDGSAVHVHMSARPLLQQDGTYLGALAVVTDVTALREAEEVLHRQGLREQAGQGGQPSRPPS